MPDEAQSTPSPEPVPQTSPARTESIDKDSRLWGTFCHLSGALGLIGVPFGGIAGPLVIWLIKREDYPFVEDQGKEALNFQISMMIYFMIGGFAAMLMIFTMILAPVGIPVFLALYIFEVVQIILASIKANEGQYYRYPLTIRFIQ